MAFPSIHSHKEPLLATDPKGVTGMAADLRRRMKEKVEKKRRKRGEKMEKEEEKEGGLPEYKTRGRVTSRRVPGVIVSI